MPPDQEKGAKMGLTHSLAGKVAVGIANQGAGRQKQHLDRVTYRLVIRLPWLWRWRRCGHIDSPLTGVLRGLNML
jgi:hypothetical protein